MFGKIDGWPAGAVDKYDTPCASGGLRAGVKSQNARRRGFFSQFTGIMGGSTNGPVWRLGPDWGRIVANGRRPCGWVIFGCGVFVFLGLQGSSISKGTLSCVVHSLIIGVAVLSQSRHRASFPAPRPITKAIQGLGQAVNWLGFKGSLMIVS